MAGKILIILLILVLLFVAYVLLRSRIPAIRFFIEKMSGAAVILSVLLIAVVIVLLVKVLLSPEGKNSVFAEKETAYEKGNAEEEIAISETEGEKAGFSISDALSGNRTGDRTVFVTVREDTVTVGNTLFTDTDGFFTAMESIREDLEAVCLVDDYARADIYHEVETFLSGFGKNLVTEKR